jgi:hypothetical protein
MNIDDELKAAGLLTVSEIMKGQPIDGFQRHAGVKDIETFKQWLDMRTEEMLRIKARLTLDGKEDSEMFEWVYSHCAAFNEVRINLNAALVS